MASVALVMCTMWVLQVGSSLRLPLLVCCVVSHVLMSTCPCNVLTRSSIAEDALHSPCALMLLEDPAGAGTCAQGCVGVDRSND